MIKLLIAPLIGAVIGYATNWLAVKMLFRPREAKYIFGRRVPLTPGVIPKGKARLAEAAANVVNEQLLTEDALKRRLLSDEVKDILKSAVDGTIEKLKADSESVEEFALSRINDRDKFYGALERIQNTVCDSAEKRIVEAKIGNTVSDWLVNKFNEAVTGTFLGKMIGGNLASSMGPAVADYINGYIENNAGNYIRKVVEEESERLLSTPVEKIANGIEASGYNLGHAAMEAYEKLVVSKGAAVVKSLNVGAVAKSAVENMSNEQLEQLVLSAMKTELSAVVNLGAVIGFVLGLVNTLIYLI